MWVTQTYLGVVEPDASIFVYYLFEDYDPEQHDFTSTVQRGLEELGELFGDRVSLLLPNPRYAVRIESEVRETVEDLWWSLRGKLPGLFVATRQLREFDGKSGEHYFISLSGADSKRAVEAIAQVRRLIYEKMSWDHAHQPTQTKPGLIQRLLAALELKPGISGIKIDLKKLGKGQ